MTQNLGIFKSVPYFVLINTRCVKIQGIVYYCIFWENVGFLSKICKKGWKQPQILKWPNCIFTRVNQSWEVMVIDLAHFWLNCLKIYLKQESQLFFSTPSSFYVIAPGSYLVRRGIFSMAWLRKIPIQANEIISLLKLGLIVCFC